MRESNKVIDVLEDIASLKDLSQTFAILDELNRILHKFLPAHLNKYCHIGAIDSEKGLVILYLSSSAPGHIIKTMANPILENFNKHHFSFTEILIRIRPLYSTNYSRHKNLEPGVKNKLQQLAQSINRMDLIEDKVPVNDIKEIDF